MNNSADKPVNNQTFSDRCFRDREGNVVLGQFPNLPIVGWLVCVVASRVVAAGDTRTGLQSVATAFLFTWAFLEITKGVNYFRRFLGAAAMAAIVFGYFSS
jgi:hypothetical protein